jgi:hypothetical protein
MIEVGPFAFVQSKVVDEARASERLSQVTNLLRCRIEPIFVGSLRHGLLALFFLDVETLLQTHHQLIVHGTTVLLCFPPKRIQHLFGNVGRKLWLFIRLAHTSMIHGVCLSVKYPLSHSKRNGTLIPPHEWRQVFPCPFDNVLASGMPLAMQAYQWGESSLAKVRRASSSSRYSFEENRSLLRLKSV